MSYFGKLFKRFSVRLAHYGKKLWQNLKAIACSLGADPSLVKREFNRSLKWHLVNFSGWRVYSAQIHSAVMSAQALSTTIQEPLTIKKVLNLKQHFSRIRTLQCDVQREKISADACKNSCRDMCFAFRLRNQLVSQVTNKSAMLNMASTF